MALLRTLTDLLAVSMIFKFSIKVNISEVDEKQRFYKLLSDDIKSQKYFQMLICLKCNDFMPFSKSEV